MLKTIDLWPDDIATKRVRAPITILREQAAVLGQKTRNLVQGDVVNNPRTSTSEYFTYDFYIEAPTLDSYSYKLLSVYHHISLYPLEINVEESIFKKFCQTSMWGRTKLGNPLFLLIAKRDSSRHYD
jgi:hypothetical protein